VKSDSGIEIYKTQLDSPECEMATKAALVAEWARLLWKIKGRLGSLAGGLVNFEDEIAAPEGSAVEVVTLVLVENTLLVQLSRLRN
jgi:hypothetical protein